MDGTNFQINLLAHLADAASLRQKVIANNLANINTPGYKRLEVEFERELSRALDRSKDPFDVKAKIVEDKDAPARVDGNTVDVDQEVNEMNRNTVLFESVLQIMNSRLGQLRSAIRGS